MQEFECLDYATCGYSGCYGFKRFTESCRCADNGKAPRELAGVDLSGLDWLLYLIDH